MKAYINGELIGELKSISFHNHIRVGSKVKASFKCTDYIMEVTGNVTKITDDSYYLNKIRFPMASCFFELV